jgi:hypothetical protein
MTRFTRSAGTLVGLAAASAVLAIGAATVFAKSASAGKADSGVVYFATTYTANGNEYAAGNASDRLFGTGALTFVIRAFPTPAGAIKITAKPVTSYYSNGTLTGTATATLTPGPNGSATVTGGKLTEAHGTGALKGHSFTATFQGTGSLTTGNYKITYKGTYK